jgi:hypothetical protein
LAAALKAATRFPEKGEIKIDEPTSTLADYKFSGATP